MTIATPLTFDFTEEIETVETVKLREQAIAFHTANPHVLDSIEKLATKLIRRGVPHFGIATIFEYLRWNFYMTTEDASSKFKLNNSYRSYYARLLVEKHPEWDEIIERRELRAK